MPTLESLYTDYLECAMCALAASRTQIVFGAGNPTARVLLLAERPSGADDRTGLPFSGPAGDLLDRILAAPKVEIPRADVYITNLVLCRAPADRPPRAVEIQTCRDRLRAQIAAVDPRLIVAMGRLAMLHFLHLKGNLESARGWYEMPAADGRAIPVFLTFNPASALYGEPEEIRRKKRLMYEDWQAVGQYYRRCLSTSDRQNSAVASEG